MAQHIADIRGLLGERGLDAVLLRSKAMKRWMQTLTGSGCSVVIARNGAWLIVDGRYIAEARSHERDLEIRPLPTQTGSALFTDLATLAREQGWHALGVEADATLASQYLMLRDCADDIVLLGDEIAELRARKTDEEISALQRAVEVTDEVFATVASQIHAGMSDFEISALLQYDSVRRGAERMSFDTIVAIGAHTAHPHGRPKGDVLHPCEHVMVDFGLEIGGFQSDMTRIVFCGKPDPEIMHIYEVARAAQETGIQAIREGAFSDEVDAAARAVIDEAGFGEQFPHGLGHGIGVDNETELPLLRQGCHTMLHEGMVMSCEPGIYVPGLGGVRIEDDVWLHGGRGVPLNHTTKDPIVIGG